MYRRLKKEEIKNVAEQYGLSLDEKIVVFWTKEVALPYFNGYRVRFRKVFSWKIRELSAFNEKKRCIRGSKQTFDHSDTFILIYYFRKIIIVL